jgi:hypothetical protein
MMTGAATGSLAAREEIARWARDHKVAWEVHTFSQKEDGVAAIRAVGHEVQLTCPAPDLVPGCPRCSEVRTHVEALAHAIIAESGGEPLCTVRPFEAALRFRPGGMQPELEVAIEIRRAVGSQDAEVQEARCKLHLEQALLALGVPHH